MLHTLRPAHQLQSPLSRLAPLAVLLTTLPCAAQSEAFTLQENPVMGTSQFTGMDLGCVTWGDYNNDGHPDFLTAGSDYTKVYALLYKNNGDGTFAHDTAASANLLAVYTSSTNSAAWADLDNDGDLDLIITGHNRTTYVPATRVYRNDGPDTNGNTRLTSLGNRGLINIADGSVVPFDHNNDGILDLLLVGSENVSLYRGHGDLTFTYINDNYSLPRIKWTAAATADFNKDGLQDVVLAGARLSGDRHIGVYYNNGDSTFTWNFDMTLPRIASGAVAAADINADGWPDITVVGDVSQNQPTGRVYFNNQNGGFTLAENIQPAGNSDLALGDFDNNGWTDIALAGKATANHFELYANSAPGTLTPASDTGLHRIRSVSMAAADYDGDGDLDLLAHGIDDRFTPPSGMVTRLYRNNTTTANNAPTAPGNLSSTVNGLDVTFTWDAATDDKTPQAALTYNLRIGTSSGAVDTLVPAPAFQPGNAEAKLTHTIKNLDRGQVYYWSVQALDAAYKPSPYSAEAITASVPVSLSSFSLE